MASSNYYTYGLNLDLNNLHSKMEDAPSCSPSTLCNNSPGLPSKFFDCDNQMSLCDSALMNSPNGCNAIGSSTIGSAITGNAITGNAITSNTITGNAITGNAITSNTITGCSNNPPVNTGNQLQNSNRILSQLLTSKSTFSLLNESKSLCSGDPATIKLIDYNPRWIYTEEQGAEQAANWMFVVAEGLTFGGSYQVKFGELATVHGLLIASSNVVHGIRCRLPAVGQPEKIKLQILENGKLLIDDLEFEFRRRPEVDTLNEVNMLNGHSVSHSVGNSVGNSVDENTMHKVANDKRSSRKSVYALSERELKFCLLERLSDFALSTTGSAEGVEMNLSDFENNAIKVLDRLSNWQAEERSAENVGDLKLARGQTPSDGQSDSLTILHLAAALGYTNLIFNLLELKDVQACNSLLDDQVNLKALDSQLNTPLMWSMAKGNEASSKLLISLCCEVCSMPNRQGQDVFEVAESEGHEQLANLARKWLADCLRTNASLRLDLNCLDEVESNLKHLGGSAERRAENFDADNRDEHSDSSNIFDCSTSSTSISGLNTLINYASKEFSLDELICDNNSLMNCDNPKTNSSEAAYERPAASNAEESNAPDRLPDELTGGDAEFSRLFLIHLKKCLNQPTVDPSGRDQTGSQIKQRRRLIDQGEFPLTKTLLLKTF